MTDAPKVVGRERELDALEAALRAACAGQPRAILVHGEAGIGKTTLLHSVETTSVGAGCQVLRGQCLRFGAEVTSYLPLIQALEQRRAGPTGTHDALGSPDGVGALLTDTEDLLRGSPLRFASVLDQVQRQKPTVLLVDDLQWADPSSLDALMYLIASFRAGGRMLLVCSYRDTDLPEGHRLHGWLADALRMPGVSDLALHRMELWTIEQLIVGRDAQVDAAAAEEVFRRSLGNPYLATLVMKDSRAGRQGSMQGRPLKDALLASWHRLSTPGRRVTQLLAIAGGPVPIRLLHDLATNSEVGVEALTPAIAEAAGEGILCEDNDALWFQHPLLAEVIAGTVRPWEATRIHRTYAHLWLEATDVREGDRATRLALHMAAAGDATDGLAWSLRAAEQAQIAHAWDEQASHLTRAVSLASTLDSRHEGALTVDLLTRAAEACDAAGDDATAVRHFEAALDRIDCTSDPLLASRILLKLHMLRLTAGPRPHLDVAEPLEALRLTTDHAPCEERALALAHLSLAEVFLGLPHAREHAESAVELAEALASDRALAWALATRAETKSGTSGLEDALRALDLALRDGDSDALTRATLCLSNTYESAGRIREAAAVTQDSFRTLRDAGHFGEAAIVGAVAASWCLLLGDWDAGRSITRELLMMAKSPRAAGLTRCNAAILAALEGDHQGALLHLQRAQELLGDDGLTFRTTQLQVWVGIGQPRLTLELIEEHITEVTQRDPTTADEWLRWAALAAAELSEGRGSAEQRSATAEALARIKAGRGGQPLPFEVAGPDDHAHRALAALYEAECSRSARDWEAGEELWSKAVQATANASMQYEHAWASLHWARAMFENRHASRLATTTLQEAHTIATRLGAVPLVERIAALSAQAHVSIGATVGPTTSVAKSATSQGDHAISRLTRRELEVLDGLIAGETYAQIAKRLFISEKTVSTHVSHLLTKTGSSSRIDLVAQYAHTPND